MVDQAKVVIKAGNGGDGVVHFRRARFIPKGGPDGGDGGRGGSVYLKTDANLATLDHFSFKQRFEAKSGKLGGGSRSSGAAGEDLFLSIPIGTVVKLKKVKAREGSELLTSSEPAEEKVIDFDKEGVEILIAKGGKGGKGNWHFKSSTNTTPREFTPGTPGEEWEVEMNLKLLADVGLVGLPNVGKSTLLSVLSKARPKIADYPFTTLEPNLGVMELGGRKSSELFDSSELRSVIIADIPGLIEGASLGKGLGSRFLRHIERTSVLVHVLAMMPNEIDSQISEIVPRLVGDYRTIRNELATYEAEVEKKKEIVVLNKTDLFSDKVVDEVIAWLAKGGIKVLPVSAGTQRGIEELKRQINRLIKKG